MVPKYIKRMTYKLIIYVKTMPVLIELQSTLKTLQLNISAYHKTINSFDLSLE